MLSKTNASSSITTTRLPLIEPSAAWTEALGSAVKTGPTTNGTTTENREPFPNAEVSSIRWSRSLHRRSTMASPSPSPLRRSC